MRVLVLLLLLPSLCFAGDWSREDTYRQSAVTALLVADWAQTRWIVRNPIVTTTTRGPYNTFSTKYPGEINPILGEHPSIGKVNNYFIATIIGHAAISSLLPHAWREGWQYVWIGIEAKTVEKNHSIGIKFSF